MSGSPHALLIEGEPGAGKTALWNEGLSLARARGYRTLFARPVEIEAALSFAGLVDLLEPVLEEALPRLPDPQRRALEIAFLLRPADAVPDRRALATGVLNALRALATASAVIVAVDDVQWLDSSSGGVLAFAARRLGTESVAFLLSRRVDGEVVSSELEAALAGRIEHLCPTPLSVGALHRLLQSSFGRPFSRPVVRRLRAVSEGNPFFTLELARGLEGPGTAIGAARQLHFPPTLREVVHDRLESLPACERELLLGVAALSQPTLELLDKAAGPGVNESSLSRALETQVVELDGARVRFTHPLLGSVLYADAGATTRRELHRRLADVVTDPEESARHLALAADGPDKSVAARLDEAAEIVAARGAPDRAAELLTRAVELTPPGDSLAPGRRIAAADCWTDAGDGARAVPLLEAAIAVALPGDERAKALARLGWIRCRNAGFRAGCLLFEEAGREPTTEPSVRISIEKGLAWADQMLGDLAAAEVHVRSAVSLAEGMRDRPLMAETLADLAFIEMLRGQPQFRATMSAALALEDSREIPGIGGRVRWLHVRARWLEALVLAWTDRLDAARAVLIELRSQASEHGHEQFLPYLLNWLGRVDCFEGNWSDGLRHAQHAHDASVQAGLEVERPYALATIALAHAHLGEVSAAQEAISDGLILAQTVEVVPGQFELLAVRGFLELSLGQPREAHATLAALAERVRAAGFAQPAVQRFHADLVEAAVEVGDLDSARRHHGELAECAANLGSPWACALSRRSAGLLAAAEGDIEAAVRQLERALVEHERLPNAFERGRTLLHLGIALRRLKHKRQARDSIGGALAVFEQASAPLWAERAHRELARISGSTSSATSELSETEKRIAALVAAGQANKQVAAELHVTVRTVESNLTRIYRKLGIRSRSQLAAQFPRGD